MNRDQLAANDSQRDRILYDPHTLTVLRKESARGSMVAFGCIALVAAAFSFGGHVSYPLLASLAGQCNDAEWLHLCEYSMAYDFAAAGIGFVCFGAVGLLAIRYRRFRPTIFCERCLGTGWVRDLAANNGRCPLCGWDRFTYYQRNFFIPGPMGPQFLPQVEHDREGSALIARMEAHRSDLMEHWL